MASLVEIAKTPMHVLWSKSHDNCDQCKAKDATCHKCSKKGLFGLECLSDQSQTKSPQAGSREGRVKVSRIKVVKCNRVSTKVIYDSEPTPMMENVKVKPNGKG